MVLLEFLIALHKEYRQKCIVYAYTLNGVWYNILPVQTMLTQERERVVFLGLVAIIFSFGK
jgi:hypothetical protein